MTKVNPLRDKYLAHIEKQKISGHFPGSISFSSSKYMKRLYLINSFNIQCHVLGSADLSLNKML